MQRASRPSMVPHRRCPSTFLPSCTCLPLSGFCISTCLFRNVSAQKRSCTETMLHAPLRFCTEGPTSRIRVHPLCPNVMALLARVKRSSCCQITEGAFYNPGTLVAVQHVSHAAPLPRDSSPSRERPHSILPQQTLTSQAEFSALDHAHSSER